MILTTPPAVPFPYRTDPPPLMISIFSISSTATVFIGTRACDKSRIFIGTPSTSILTRPDAFSGP